MFRESGLTARPAVEIVSNSVMGDRRELMRRYLAIWNGEADLELLDELMTPTFVGHIGSQSRDLAHLKQDISAYRRAVPSVQFTADHQFGEGDFLATRTSAHATDSRGRAVSVSGINISRWEGDRLAEEWAVWESFPTDGPMNPSGAVSEKRT